MFDLNSPQKNAVHHIDGPLLVLAGAGSGKTRVITQKIVHLIKKCDIAAHNIVAVTFTNKAAREMKKRVSELLEKKLARGLKVSTFHALGLDILKKEYKNLEYKANFTIFDTQDCVALINTILEKDVVADLDANSVLHKISQWKNQLLQPQDIRTRFADSEEDVAMADVYQIYLRYMKAYNAFDFDDLICLPVKLFESQTEILDKWQNKIRYLLVDEYQDTNLSQYRMVKLLAGVRQLFTVVGDDDQSIYAWRGAEPENMLRLRDDYPRLRVIKLEQNYRSTGCILQAANHLIANNPHVFEKRLWCDLGFGEPIQVIQTKDETHEAERVVSQILQNKFQKRAEYGDCAILYRGNHQSRLFEKCLRAHQIPYRLTGSTSFFAHTEVKDVMAYLRLIANSDDDNAFLRVINTPRREIGPVTIEKLSDYAAQRGVSLCEAGYELGLEHVLPEKAVQRLRHFIEWLATMQEYADSREVSHLVKHVIEQVDYELWVKDNAASIPNAERKLENVYELIEWISYLEKRDEQEFTLSELISHMQLMDILERNEEEQEENCVNLLTLHSAKGLEFPYVFIVGMEEELLPHKTSILEDNLEEERRLAYVGVTRAQRLLTVTYAQKRKKGGEVVECSPSRFLDELPEETVSWERSGEAVDPQVRQERGRAHLDALRGILSDG